MNRPNESRPIAAPHTGCGRRRRVVAGAILVLVPLATAVGCGEDAPEPELSAAGARGKVVADRLNCQSCHSTDGSELTGPSWKDLFGATIRLKGGGETTVDDEYLERAVRTPGAERRDDATGQMPTFDESRLSDEELADVVAYIHDLSAAAPTDDQTTGE